MYHLWFFVWQLKCSLCICIRSVNCIIQIIWPKEDDYFLTKIPIWPFFLIPSTLTPVAHCSFKSAILWPKSCYSTWTPEPHNHDEWWKWNQLLCVGVYSVGYKSWFILKIDQMSQNKSQEMDALWASWRQPNVAHVPKQSRSVVTKKWNYPPSNSNISLNLEMILLCLYRHMMSPY